VQVERLKEQGQGAGSSKKLSGLFSHSVNSSLGVSDFRYTDPNNLRNDGPRRRRGIVENLDA